MDSIDYNYLTKKSEIQIHLWKLYNFYNENKYTESINYYKDNESNLESSSEALGILGRCYLNVNNNEKEKALEFFKKSLEKDQENSLSIVGMAFLNVESKSIEETIENLEAAKQHEKNNHDIYLFLAKIYEKNKEYNKAINEYNNLLIISPGNHKAILSISILENLMGKYEDARQKLIDLHNINDKDLKVIKTLAKGYMKQKRFDECQRMIDLGLNQDKNNISLMEMSMYCWDKIGDYNKLELACRSTLIIDKKSSKAISFLIKSFQKNQKFKELEKLLDKINSKVKSKGICENSTNNIQTKLDKIAKVIKNEQIEIEKKKSINTSEEDLDCKMVKIQKTVINNPSTEPDSIKFKNIITQEHNNVESLFNLGVHYFKIKNYKEALDHLVKLNDINPYFESEKTKSILGDLYFKDRNKLNESLNFYKELYNNTKKEIYLIKMGRCYEKMKNYDIAISLYQDSILNNKNYVNGNLHIGWLLFRLGDKIKALEYLKIAYDLAPDYSQTISKYCLVLLKFSDRITEANNIIKKALALEPDSIELIICYCKSFEKMKNYDQAIKILEDAMSINKKLNENSEAIYCLAFINEKKKNYNKSIQLYKIILCKKKDHIPSLIRLGNLLCSMREYDRSMKYLIYALQFEKNLTLANFGVGKIFQFKGDKVNSLKFFDLCIENDPSFYKVYYQKGLIFIDSKEYDKAKEEFIICLNLNQDYHLAMVGLANVYYSESEFEKAEELLQKALTFDKEETLTLISLGNTMMGTKRYNEAINYYKKALEENPDMIEANYNLANCYYLIGKIENSITLYVKVIKMDEKRPDFYYNLANALTMIDKYKEAIKSYKKVIALDSKYYDAYFNVANAYFMLGSFQQALNYYEYCLKLKDYKKDDNEIKFSIAKLFIEFSDYKEDNLSKARIILDELFMQNEKNPNTIYYMGKLHEKEKNMKLARAQYEKIIEIDSTNINALNSLNRILNGKLDLI